MSVLTLAIPSKGRLMEATSELLEKAGFAITRLGAERGYRGSLSGIDGVEVAFLSASEIAQNLRDGSKSPGDYLKPPSASAAVAVLIADLLVSQITAQVFPRFINPLVDLFVNEPRWEVMVQAAHDDALQALSDNVVRKVSGKAMRGEP